MSDRKASKVYQIIEDGECQHITRSGRNLIWCLKDECIFCGFGSEWR